MKASASAIVAALVLATSLSVAPASAAGLLGNLLGGGSTDSLASIDSGSAGDSSPINVGLGNDSSSPNNIADVKIGGSSGLLGGDTVADVTVTGGNGQGGLLNSGGVLGTGLLDGDDDGGVLGSSILGSNLTAGINLGGLGLDLTVPGLDDLLCGGNGAGGRVIVGTLDGSMTVSCSVNDGRQVLQLASQAKVNPASWGPRCQRADRADQALPAGSEPGGADLPRLGQDPAVAERGSRRCPDRGVAEPYPLRHQRRLRYRSERRPPDGLRLLIHPVLPPRVRSFGPALFFCVEPKDG